MQNDEVLLDVIRGGEFVHPCHPKGLNRVDLRDVGEVAAGILLDPSTPSGTYPVVGPRSLTGPECAQVWAEALGRPVRYAGDDDAALEAALAAHLTGYRLDDWLSSLRKLRGFAVHATPEELDDDRAPARPPAHRLHRVRPPRRRRARARRTPSGSARDPSRYPAPSRVLRWLPRRPPAAPEPRRGPRADSGAVPEQGGRATHGIPGGGSVGGMPCHED